MPSQDDILSAMQFAGLVGKSINSTGSSREVVTYQYAGTSQPVDYFSFDRTGWTDFSTAEKTKFEAALANIETFLNVDFVEITGDDDPDMNVGKVDFTGSSTGLGGYSASSSFDGAITRFDSYVVFDNTLDLTGELSLLLHELGHAMGLKHTFSTPAVPAGTDNNKYSVLSYTANPDTGLDGDAMQLYDILALQDLWGEVAYNAGDTRYTGKRTDTTDAIWDSGGTDILDASASSTDVTLDLRSGKFSTFGGYQDVVVAYNTDIENATGGAGSDALTGNGLANILKGGKGKDTLKGNGQSDDLRGGNGNDKLLGGRGNDDLFGGKGRDKLTGGGGRDDLTGGAGADKFIFKGKFGKDTIRDFTDDIDTLKINRSDVSSIDDALGFAVDSGGDVVFTFDDGSRITVEDMTKAALSDDMQIV